MHQDLLECAVVGGRKRHLVIYATTTVGGRIYQHNYLFNRRSANDVIQSVYLLCGEIAVGLECVVVRIENTSLPLTIMRDAWAGVE